MPNTDEQTWMIDCWMEWMDGWVEVEWIAFNKEIFLFLFLVEYIYYKIYLTSWNHDVSKTEKKNDMSRHAMSIFPQDKYVLCVSVPF